MITIRQDNYENENEQNEDGGNGGGDDDYDGGGGGGGGDDGGDGDGGALMSRGEPLCTSRQQNGNEDCSLTTYKGEMPLSTLFHAILKLRHHPSRGYVIIISTSLDYQGDGGST